MPKSLNSSRRKLTKILTSGIKDDSLLKFDPSQKNSIKNILIIRPNHRLGNQLLITPLIQELENEFKNCNIDIFLKGGIGNVIFKNYSSVRKIIFLPKDHFKNILQYINCWIRMSQNKYDLIINVMGNSSSGKLATRLATGRFKVYGNGESNEVTNLPSHKAQLPIYHLRQFLDNLESTYPSLNIKLDQKEISNGSEHLKTKFGNDKETISIFTYATGKKCYSEDWWILFYNTLLENFGDKYNILEILPNENISQIQFKAPTFLSNNVREIAGVIENSKIFISADCGIMHLGCATNTPVLGLFSVTDSKKYGPYGDFNKSIETKKFSMHGILDMIRSLIDKKASAHALENL